MLILEDLNFTIKEKEKIEYHLKEVQSANQKFEELIKIEEEKMILQDKKMTNELKLADVDDKYKRKKEKCLIMPKNFKKYVVKKKMHLNYALGGIVILVIIIIAMYASASCIG